LWSFLKLRAKIPFWILWWKSKQNFEQYFMEIFIKSRKRILSKRSFMETLMLRLQFSHGTHIFSSMENKTLEHYWKYVSLSRPLIIKCLKMCFHDFLTQSHIHTDNHYWNCLAILSLHWCCKGSKKGFLFVKILFEEFSFSSMQQRLSNKILSGYFYY
jgi:hypothetical protein